MTKKSRKTETEIRPHDRRARRATTKSDPSRDELPDIKRILRDFMAAHSDGMTALQKRDFAKLGAAINREQDLIAEQRALIEQQRRGTAHLRQTSETLRGATRAGKKRKRSHR